jgi:hypothetical protein
VGVLTQTCPAPGVARSLLAGAGCDVVGCDGVLMGLVVAEAGPHDSTPQWPLQAPERFVPVRGVPFADEVIE